MAPLSVMTEEMANEPVVLNWLTIKSLPLPEVRNPPEIVLLKEPTADETMMPPLPITLGLAAGDGRQRHRVGRAAIEPQAVG